MRSPVAQKQLQLRVDGPSSSRGPARALGIHGEIAAVVAVLRHHGVETTFEELMGLSGTAFRTHFFRIEVNPGLPLGPDPSKPDALWAPRYDWECLRHNNFGHLEAIAYETGFEVRDMDALDVLEFWKMVRFEVDGDRPVIVIGPEGADPMVSQLLCGYTLLKDPLRQQLALLSVDGPSTLELPPPTPLSKPASDMIPASAVPLPDGYHPRTRRPMMPARQLILVRPGEPATYRAPLAERRGRALTWARLHAHLRKELVHETRVFYAVGLSALDAFRDFLASGVEAELARPTTHAPDPAEDMARLCASVVQEWARARRTAQRCLEVWDADAVGVTGDIDLGRAAAAYGRAADAFEPLSEIFGVPETADAGALDRRAEALEAFEAVVVAELEAVASLE